MLRPQGAAAEGRRLQGVCRTALAAPTRCHVVLHWHSLEASSGFPDFDGILTLEPDQAGATSLHLTGQLRSPDDVAQREHEEEARAIADRVLRQVEGELRRAASEEVEARPHAATRYRVRDLMTADPLTLGEDLPLDVAVLLLLEKRAGGAPVIGAAGGVVGVLTESDLLAKGAAPRLRRGPAARDEERRHLAETAWEACSRPAVTIGWDATVRTAARELLDRDLSMLVALDGDRLVGIISRHDVLRALAHSATELQGTVNEVMATADAEGGLRARVTGFGQVLLKGSVGQRSAVDRVVAALMVLDGISDVRTEAVEWQHDDTTGR